MTPRIRLLLTDDHGIVRCGLAAVLGMHADMVVVAEAATAEAAVALHLEHSPDITLMDVRLGKGADGLDALAQIRFLRPQARVIMLAAERLEADWRRALHAGACAFLIKSIPHDDLAAAIRHVHRHGSCPGMKEIDAPPSHPGLTPRELEVLQHLQRGLSNPDIAKALGISEQTVLSHLKGLFSKLEAANRTEAVTEGYSRGYLRVT